MSEDNPTPSPPEDSTPSVEPTVAGDAATSDTAATTPTPATSPLAEPAPIPAPEPWSAAPAAVATHPKSHVLIPKSVVFGVVGIMLAGLGFGIGWVAKPDSESNSRPEASGQRFSDGNPFRNDGPPTGNGGANSDGNGNGRNNGNNNGTQAGGAFLGVSATVPAGNGSGAAVARVVKASPADNAGLTAGDVITKVDTTSITSPQELVREISGRKSGDKVTVTYTRGGDTKTAVVTLGDRSSAPSQTPSPQQPSLAPSPEN